jgi:hypothetical protein
MFAPLVAALIAAVAAPPTARPALIVAVPAARTVGDVPQRLQAAFETALVAEARKLDGVAALGAAEIGDMLASAAEGRMRGCTQDDACLLEVAAALGIDELLSVEVAADGDGYAVSFRRLSARTGRPVVADRSRVKKGDGQPLLDAVGPVVQALYPDKPLRPGLLRGVDPEIGRRLNPPPLPRWAFAATATAAAMALATGATFGLLANNARDDYKALADRSRLEVVPGAELIAVQDRLDTNARMANIFLVAGGALAAAAVAEGFFTDWKEYRSHPVVVAVPGGAQVAVAGRF